MQPRACKHKPAPPTVRCASSTMFWARQGGGDWDDTSSSSSSSSSGGGIRVPGYLRTSAISSCTTRGGFTFSTWTSAVSEPLFVAQTLHGAMQSGGHSSPTALLTALELNQRMLSALPAMTVDVRSGDCGTCLPGCSSCTGFFRCSACATGYTHTPLLSLFTPPASGDSPHVLEQLLSGLDVCLPTATALRIAAERAASPAVTAMSGPPTASHPTAPAPAPEAAKVTWAGPQVAAPMPAAPAPEPVMGAPMPAPVPLALAPAPAPSLLPAYVGRSPSPVQAPASPLRLESNAAFMSPPPPPPLAPPPALITVAAVAAAPPHGAITQQPTVIALTVTVSVLLLLLCIGLARRAARSRVIFVVKAADVALESGLETPRGKGPADYSDDVTL